MNMMSWMGDKNDKRANAFNYRTGQYDLVDLGTLNNEQLLDYMPQDPNVQAIFRIHQELGLKPLQAMEKALFAWLGK